MALKFNSTPDELIMLIESTGRKIVDVADKGHMTQIKVQDGGIVCLHRTGTVQFQGSAPAKASLEAALTSALGVSSELAAPEPAAKSTKPKAKVFIVHGHDATAREQLELVIHKLGLDPYVLQNSGGGGLTIIEALEKGIGNSEDAATFGIVLLTPDDMGYSKQAGEKEIQPRARQNVVLEMGMLISALGRPRVAILKKQHLEVPSDAQGILYIPFNEHVKETVPKLVDRLQQAGFVIGGAAIAKASS